MRDKYSYMDPDSIYMDAKSGVLKNLGNLTDAKDLSVFESMAVNKRMQELQKHPIAVKNAHSLLEIHRHLFQDVYEWAGQKRKVEISKNGRQFFLSVMFDNGFAYIDGLLVDFKKLNKSDKKQIARKLAEILDSVNYLHPFREGNGRTQREFIRCLALEKGYKLNLNPPDRVDVYERYMRGTIEGDVEELAELVGELMA
jgi:cell filamentation protein